MLKRQTELTPQEKRVRRFRATLYTLSAAVLVAVLFGLAWFGTLATRQNPRQRLSPLAEAPAGELVFRISATVHDARWLMEDDTEQPIPFDQSTLTPLLDALGDEGQVFYWPSVTQGAEDPHWLAFIPLKGPQRYRVRHVEEALRQSAVFVPAEGMSLSERVDEEPALGYFRVNGQGVLIGSDSAFPEYKLVDAPPPIAGAAEYRAEGAFLPVFLAERFPDWSLIRELEERPMEQLKIVWVSEGGDLERGTHLTVTLAETGEERTESSPYFDPLIPENSEDAASDE